MHALPALILLAIVAAVGVPLVATSIFHARTHASQALGRAQLIQYQSRVTPIIKDWGSIEVEGMQPGIQDLAPGSHIPAAAVVGEARAWTEALKADREKFAAVTPPPQLRRAAALFTQGLDLYIKAATQFRRAAQVAGARQHALLVQGVDNARHGDALYDRASYLLQQARLRDGLQVSRDFPPPGP